MLAELGAGKAADGQRQYVGGNVRRHFSEPDVGGEQKDNCGKDR